MPGGEIRQSESGKDGDQRKKTRPGEQLKKGGLNSLQGSIKAYEYQKDIHKKEPLNQVADLRERPNQVENQLRRDRGFISKQLMNVFRMCRSQETSEVQWPSSKQRQDSPSLSNSKRGIGSENPAASTSAYWVEKMGEASSAKDTSSAQIKQLQREKSAIIKDLPEQKNESNSFRITRQLSMNKRKIQLEEFKKRNAILREKVLKLCLKLQKTGS